MLEDYEVVFAALSRQKTIWLRFVSSTIRRDCWCYGKINARIMDAAPALRVISKHGSGIERYRSNGGGRTKHQRPVCACANAAAVAEHTWAMILACTKSLIPLDRRMRDGYWDKSHHKSLELEGRTLGLVGPGAIGGRVADIGRVFGMQVIAYDPWAKTLPAGCEQ